MTDTQNPNPNDKPDDDAKPDGLPPDDALNAVPIEEDEDTEQAPAQPRRAASAQFMVDTEVGSEAALREAMDPANQSLTEALRLSYRVLQLVILVLVALFLLSGVQVVETNETGVKTRFGAIVGEGEGAALRPGIQFSILPYPVSDFVIFNETRSVNLTRVNYAGDRLHPFWPNAQIRPGDTWRDTAANVQGHELLVVGRDGFVMASDGIAHLQARATYSVEFPRRYVESVRLDQADDIVSLALQRGVIHATSELTVDSVVAETERIASRIREKAQELLYEIDCGIRIDRVEILESIPPLAVQRAREELQQSITAASQRRSQADQERGTELVQTAGTNFQELLDLIDEYEMLVDSQDLAEDSPEAQAALDRINTMLRSERVGGLASQFISFAETYESEIEATLGGLNQRFQSILPQYRVNPDVVVRRMWIDTYASVLSKQDAEIFQVPGGSGEIIVRMRSSSDVMNQRRRADQDRREREAREGTGLDRQYLQRFQDSDINRRLRVGEGGVTGAGGR